MAKVRNIHFLTPYDKAGLAPAYNKAILSAVGFDCHETLHKDDWIVLMDGDTMFLTSDWGDLIRESIEKFGREYALMTGKTNRIYNTEQLHGGKISDNPDILHHAGIARELRSKPLKITESTGVISGFIMIFSAATWDKAGGFKGSARHKFTGVDNDFHRAVVNSGGKVGIIENLYMFHYYRFHKSIKDTSHLK